MGDAWHRPSEALSIVKCPLNFKQSSCLSGRFLSALRQPLLTDSPLMN